MLISYICGVFLLTFVWSTGATNVVKKKVSIGIEPKCKGSEKYLDCADSEEKKIYRINLDTNEYVSTDILCGRPYVSLPYKDTGVIVTINQIIYIYNGDIGGDGDFKYVTALDDRKPYNYIDDCTPDSEGYLWCVTNTLTNATRSLYIIKEKAWLAFRPYDYGSSFGFSPDSKHIYFIDLKEGVIYVYSLVNGGITNKRVLFVIGTLSVTVMGKPYSLVVDIKGNIFFSVGNAIVKISSSGKLLSIITLPAVVKRVASVTFGGKNLGTLYASCTTETNGEIYAINGLGTSGIKQEVDFGDAYNTNKQIN